MDKNTKDWVSLLVIAAVLACEVMAVHAVTSWDQGQWESDWAGFAAITLPGLGLLYWPMKWWLAHRHRTAPEREQAREVSRRLADERESARRQRRAEEQAARRERTEHDRRERGVAAARNEAEAFYARHADLLQDEVPEALFRANVQSHFVGGLTAEQAWAVSRDMIAQLQPLVAQARQREKERERERRRQRQKAQELQAHIDRLRERVARIRNSPIDDAEFRQAEVEGNARKIKELEAQKRQLEADTE